MAQKKIKVTLTKAGTAYDAAQAYRLHDYILIDDVTMYVCKRVDKATMTCVGHALTETDYWDKCIDLADARKKLTDAAAQATQAVADANKTVAAINTAEQERVKAEAKREADFKTSKEACDASTTNANQAATDAATATKNATDAATGAEKVNATITDDNSLEVTDRTGATKTLALAEQTAINEKIADLEVRVSALSNPNNFVGFTRVNGDASGDATTTYGDADLLHEVAAEWKLATVKNGVVTHVAAPGRLTLDENGEEMKIDGSDGDMMLINRNAHLLKATKVIDGKELNLIGIGKTPASWYGVTSKKMPAFGMTPCETVQGKIFDDVRSQAHCVYNTSDAVKGSFAAPNGTFKESYIKSGAGYVHAYASAVSTIQQAQNKNADALTARPYMGWYYETYECLLATMFAEIGSLKHTDLNMFGCGSTNVGFSADNFNDAAISGTAGFNFIMPDGTNKYASLWGSVSIDKADAKQIMYGVNGGYELYTFIQMLEGQRILDGIAKAGLVDKIGQSTNIFYYGENGAVVCSTDGSINPTTGAGMEDLKFYYVVRSVPKCQGMADGVMTAVVNRYVKMQVADNVYWNDKTTSLAGAACVMKVSIPVYRGFTLPWVGYFRQMSYAYYTIHNVEGALTADFRCAERMEDIQSLKVFSQDAYQTKYGTLPPLIASLPKKYDVPVASNFTEQWVKSSNYSQSLFCHKSGGGGFRSQENAYWLLYFSNNGGTNTSQVHGSVVGCSANNGSVSARSARCDDLAGAGWNAYAGAFAVLLNQNQK